MSIEKRKYVGARYVPLFSTPLEWSNTRTYEPLTIVEHQGNSYTSRQFVPVGIDISNEDYWALSANYNAKVEQYRQEVQAFDGRITQNATDIANVETTIAAPEEEGLEGLKTQSNELELRGSTYSRVAYPMFNGHGGVGTSVNPMPVLIAAASYIGKDLVYGNTTALDVKSFADETFVDPHDHLVGGKMQIDCSTLVQLAVLGVNFSTSGYNTVGNVLRGCDFNPFGETEQKYAYPINGIAHGRTLASQFAKMLYDSGRLAKIRNANQINPGMVIFHVGGEEHYFWENIDHCAICVSNTANEIVVVEASDAVGTTLPVNCHKLKSMESYKYGYYPSVTPPNLSNAQRSVGKGDLVQNVATTITRPYVGVLKIGSSTTANVTVNISFTDRDGSTSTVSRVYALSGNGGCTVLYMPNWTIEVTSTSANSFYKYEDEPNALNTEVYMKA